MVIVAGATIFGHFMAVTRVPFELSAWAGSLSLPPSVIMIVIILIYLFGGCFMDAFALIMLTVPINVYVVHGVTRDVPLETIFRGVLPLFAALIICNILILLFPEIALFLPNLMR